jgi:hypothetical protein
MRFTLLFCLALVLGLSPQLLKSQETDKRERIFGKGWRLDQASKTDLKLPRVLLIGDSILNGYLKPVCASLKGKAYVDAWINGYCQSSERLFEMTSEVLSHGPYDVIHFNMGLHGLTPGRIPLDQFEPLTKKLVETLREGSPGAKLIWASTTPMTSPEKLGTLEEGANSIVLHHNQMAANVMKELGVPINDLYSLMCAHLETARHDGVHWEAAGHDLQAAQISQVLADSLKSITPAK